MIPNRKILLPVLAWTLLSAGVFAGALIQQETGKDAVPYLTLSNVFGWIASLLVLYLVLVWPVALEGRMERFSRQQLRQGSFFFLGFLEAGLLVMYSLPVLLIAASFGDKGLGAILQTLLILAALALATLGHFNLGFYFHWNLVKSYFLVMGAVCALVPLTNLVFPALYGDGPAFLNRLNPFFAVFCVASPAAASTWSWLTSVVVFGGLGLLLVGVPVLLAWPLRVYKDLA
jgi:hypothetical protein